MFMKRTALLLPLLLGLATNAAAKDTPAKGAAAKEAPAKAAPAKLPAFEKMKSLVGTWTGKTTDGKTATMTYELISGNTAILERMDAGDHNMVSVYHPDGDRLMMTHYCAINNQPRMRSEPKASGKEIRFSFVDATNLKTPDAGHMHSLLVRFEDDRHLTQEWTFSEKGEEKTEKFSYERKK